MKMTPLLWRIVSVWLCVAVVCWYPSCYVGCTESGQETQRPIFSQDISSEEESGENSNHQKNQESRTLPTQSISEKEQQIEEEQITQEVNKKEYVEAFKVKDTAVEIELEPDEQISLPDHSSVYQHPETSVTQDQDSASLLPSPESLTGFSAENNDDPNIHNPQDDIPASVSSEASYAPIPEVTDSELPPADCEEEETNPYDNESPPIVLENTSNAHITGTKTHSDPAHSTPHLEPNTSHMAKEQDSSFPASTDTDPAVSSKDPEDIPTFDEWKRKMMEVEKEKTLSTHTSNNGGSHTVKKVQKNFNNYASVECGAKILGANPEAKSTSAILKENMDLYMLNPCSNKIWFIIELCEPIQVKQLDIANFELFSSTPKDFLVSISDRYPTNKWLKLGTFHARDERTVQSFPLDEHLYAKYVKFQLISNGHKVSLIWQMFTKYLKVELVSHFGSEHFCPLSLIRVFGTSMVEEYEEIDPSERPDDQDDYLDSPSGLSPADVKSSKNLIGTAKDAIFKMVNDIAVNVLGGGQDVPGNLSSQEVNMTEPSQEFETTTKTTTDFTPVEEVKISPDPEIPETPHPSSETPVQETPTATDGSKQELPPVEESIVVPLEKDDEEPISSTIILLDKEEELDEDKEKQNDNQRQQESLICCIPSLSASCSCAASPQEYLQQQCSALLSERRKCQTVYKKQMIPPILTATWHLPLTPSVCPEPQQHPSEIHQPHEKEQDSEQEPQNETSKVPGKTIESISEPPQLEPSQTVNLPKPSATDSSSAKHTSIVETPQLSSEEPAREPEPEKSQDMLSEEKHVEPSASLSSTIYVKPSASATVEDLLAAPTDEKPNIETYKPEIKDLIQTQDKKDQSGGLLPTTSPNIESHPDPPVVPESSADISHPPDTVPDPEPSGSHAPIMDTKLEDLTEDLTTSSGFTDHLPRPPSSAPLPTSQTFSDIYADPPNGTDQNGNLVHGTSQKESVFMRLNNRIKALEMNMSLSGRYLEQLSQRYRKQMEEMQRAFNMTIIKLQNTSKIAEEQDQRQTESILLLQGQLENVTQLVLNLSVRVSQLQSEVSDRQNYLLVSLVLCLCLGLLLCANHCRISAVPPATEPEPPIPKSYSYCCPERQFTACDESGMKRSASYPLIHSESFQLATTEGPELLHGEETRNLCTVNRKKRRRKIKLMEKVETLKPSFHASELCNGAGMCNGVPVTTNPTPLTKGLLQPTFRDSPSEGSSEGSSHSDDPSFCGITTACSRICDGLPPPKTRAEKRALRRRRSKPSCMVVDLLHAPKRDKSGPLPISTIQDIIKRKTEHSSGTIVALSGPV